MMRTVHLHGKLGKTFGRSHRFAVESVQEAIQALVANFPSFAPTIREGFYRVVVGKSARAGMELDTGELAGFKLGAQDLHVVPVTEGAARGGLGKIVAGIALVGLSAMTGGAALMSAPLWAGSTTTLGTLTASIGTSMIVTGVATMIAPEVKKEDETKSFTMSGPTNSTQEGGIVPIIYGEVFTGGMMISGGVQIVGKEQDAASSSIKTVLEEARREAIEELENLA